MADDREAQEAQAKKLREEIEQLQKADDGAAPVQKKESPRDFINRRMRELEQEEEGK